MGNLSAHFDSSEFKCKCGCGGTIKSKLLVERLEQLHSIFNADAIIITSGYRCPKHSVAVGGSSSDAHTYGIAADIQVKKNGKYLDAFTIAEQAEKVGFGGIGIMNNALHVDTRDTEKYKNNHWFGNELTGENNIKTFQRSTTSNNHTVKIIVDGATVYEGVIK